MKVRVSSVLHDYTAGRSEIEAQGATLAALLADLDRRHPGLRFRVVDEQDSLRPHMNVFVGGVRTRDLTTRLAPGVDVQILHALSGG